MDRLVLALLLVGAVGPVQGAEPQAPAGKPGPEPVDAELLEFLGTLDTEEEGWLEYLEDRPMRAKAKEPEAKPAPQPAAKPVKVEKP